jgi:beta-ureidopropionase / N-carbamoyl-L-amino-acid hydrolase
MQTKQPKINKARLMKRLDSLSKIGARSDGGICRIALTDEDKAARDQVVRWMDELNLETHVDQVGNLIGIRPGKNNLDPVVMGSHIDTVPTGGRFDGVAGVIAGLEVIATLNEYGIQTEHPVAIVSFTNEEGVRYQNDLIGSRAFCNFMSLEEAYASKGTDGTLFVEELKRIGYAGKFPCGSIQPHAFVELHIEQGPVLDREKVPIGVVEAITGIAWYEVRIQGEANHAGTTPMSMRRDAGLTAAHVITYLREFADALGENQRATCGAVSFSPNAINVIPEKAVLSIDLRNSDEATLKKSEKRLRKFLKDRAQQDGVHIETRLLSRVRPESCHPDVISAITESVQELDHPYRSMISGAVHDALILARCCPTGMIFVPSKDGLSHNPAECIKRTMSHTLNGSSRTA